MEFAESRNLFSGANSCRGFYSLFDQLVSLAGQAYILKGGPGTGKSTLMRSLGRKFREHGFSIEAHRCTSDPDSLDGLFCSQLGVVIVDGTAPHVVELEEPGVRDEIVNLGDSWEVEKLWRKRKEIARDQKESKDRFKEAYRFFGQARLVHKHLEKENERSVPKKKLNRLAAVLFNQTGAELEDEGKEGSVRHLFASALTPEGPVNYFAELTASCTQRFIIKGISDLFRSHLLKEVEKLAQTSGYSLEVACCGFIPDRRDMVLIPGLKAAFIDGGRPHSICGDGSRDRVVDLSEYEPASHHGEKEEKRLSDFFWELIAHGVEALSRARSAHQRLEKHYITAMDFSGNDAAEDRLFHTIFSRARSRGYLERKQASGYDGG